MNFEVKGLDTVIKALSLAQSSEPGASFRLLVVGRGNERKYREMAAANGVGDAVVFAGTRSKGLERYYRAADCFAMLSAFDTFGMVVLEAMAAGLPIMISSGVGAKDLVEEGVNGFVLADREDYKAAAGMISALLDPDRRHAMGRAASQTASSHGWDRLAERMRELYIDVLSAKGRCNAESVYRGHDGPFADNSIL
jgi:UDP-glucose:(heptosyl)LPS alpha-1,3-glucosyltransferase